MANPQKENGYTAVANEILEALIFYRIPGEQMQCLLFILRKTYGFNKKWDAIAGSQFIAATGINKQKIYRALKGLIDKNIVIKKDTDSVIKYCFNKNYKTWKSVSKKIPVSKRITGVIKKDYKSVSKKTDTKDNTKDNTKDKNIYSRVIDYLNKKTGKNFKSNTKNTRSFISARLSEGFKELDFYVVINNKLSWLSDPKMREFLRPQTLFGTKFDSYLQDMPTKVKQQLKPTTYAQAQDAERRQRAKWLLEEMKDDKQKDDNQRINEDVPQLSEH